MYVPTPSRKGSTFRGDWCTEGRCRLCFADETEGQSGAGLGLPALLSGLVQAYLWFQTVNLKSL